MSDSTIQIGIEAVNQRVLTDLARDVATLKKEVVDLSAKNEAYSKSADKAAAANAKLDTSFSGIAAAAKGVDGALKKQIEWSGLLLDSTNSLVAAQSNADKELKKLVLTSKDLTSQIGMLDSVMAKQSSLTAELTQLNNANYVSELKINASLAEQISLRKAEIFAYEKAMSTKTAAQASYNAEAMKGISAAERLIGVQTAGSASNRAIAEQMIARSNAQASYNAEAMKGAIAAERLIGIQTAGAAANKAIADQMIARYAVQTNHTKLLTEAQDMLHTATRGVSGAFGNLWMTYGQVLPLLTGFMAAASAVKVFKTGSEFEYINTMTAALSGGTIKAKELNEELLKMRGYGRTPTDLAEGLQSLVKAGRSATEALKELPTVSMFATIADNMPLDRAAEELTQYYNAFKSTTTNLKGEMASFAEFSDILVTAVHGSTAGFTDFNTALKYLLPLASKAKFSFQEVSAASMILADVGLKGSIGTTALRTALTRMITPTDEIKKGLAAAGVELEKFIEGDNIKSLGGMVEALRQVREQMNAEQWQEFSKTGFGFRGELVVALIDKIDEYNKALLTLGESAGSTKIKFEILAITTQMRMDELGASFERAFITAFNGEKATKVIGELDKLVNSSGFASSLQDIVTGTVALASGFTSIAGVILSVPTWVLEVGVVGAFLFGKTGKIAAGAIIATAAGVDKLKTSLEDFYYANSNSAVDPRVKVTGIAAAQAEVAELQDKMDSLGRNQYSETTDRKLQAAKARLAVLKEIYEVESEEKSAPTVKKPNEPNSPLNLASTKEVENTEKRLAGLFEYADNLDNRKVANKLANLEKQRVADIAYFDGLVNQEATAAVGKRLVEERYINERKGILAEDSAKSQAHLDSELNKKQVAAEKIKSIESELDVFLGNIDDVTTAKKLESNEKWLNAKTASIEAESKVAGVSAEKTAELINKANLKRMANDIDVWQKEAGEIQKVQDRLDANTVFSTDQITQKKIAAIEKRFKKQL